MKLTSKHTVTLPCADKVKTAALAVEYWTSKGFRSHSQSCNCFVFRSLGYGSSERFLGWIVHSFFDVVKPFDETPVELTMLCQNRPLETRWELEFQLEEGVVEGQKGSFSTWCQSMCDDYSAFCLEWIKTI